MKPMEGNGSGARNGLCGTWKLVSYQRTVVATGETTDFFGSAPRGFLNYSPDGRMIVIVVKEERPSPADPANVTDQDRAGLFKSMLAYGGKYSFDGKDITHHVDISWNEHWTGTDQLRHVRLEGRRLILSTDPLPDANDGTMIRAVLTWERVGEP